MKSFSLKLITVIILLLVFSVQASAAPNMNFTIVGDEHINMPLCYSCTQIVTYLGNQGKTFLDASDLFIDKEDNIYITDTNNNRIIMLDKSGNYVKEFTNGGKLNSPKSVFVADNGDLFVADTGNLQITHLDSNDKQIEVFVKPETEMLSENIDFSVTKLAVSEQGLIYVVQSQNFMMIDSNNEFKGYVGANKVGFNIKEFFVRTFGSEIQKNKMQYTQAATYNSFDIGDDGLIYAVANDTKNQVRVLNVDGDNLFPEGQYGESVMEDKSTTMLDAVFMDICVDKYGMIHAMEKNSGRIYVYTPEGDLVVAYGGIGSIKGKFLLPVAVDVNSKGEVFVLDGSGGAVHKFTPTEYMNNLLETYQFFGDGEYDAAIKKGRENLSINNNCYITNTLVGKVLYKQGEYKVAMEYFKAADNKEQYAKAFSKYRHEIFRGYFGWIVLAVCAIGTGIFLLIVFLKKKAKKSIEDYYYTEG